MAYTANIPQPNDQISQSQGLILANFQSIAASFDLNHVTFNVADAGKHAYLTMVNNAAAPVGGVATEFLMYNKVPAAPFPLTGNQEIFIQRILGASPYIAPMTAKSFNTGASSYAYLPCGLLLKFGQATTDPVTGHLAVPINMNLIAQAYTSVPFAFVTGKYTGGHARFASVRILTSSQLDVSTRDAAGAETDGIFNWLTIGVY